MLEYEEIENNEFGGFEVTIGEENIQLHFKKKGAKGKVLSAQKRGVVIEDIKAYLGERDLLPAKK